MRARVRAWCLVLFHVQHLVACSPVCVCPGTSGANPAGEQSVVVIDDEDAGAP